MDAEAFFSPATGCNIILYAVDKELNEDSGNQTTDESYPQPEHILPHDTKPKYKNAQKTHYGSEKGFQSHSAASGGRGHLERWPARHGECLPQKIVGLAGRQVNGGWRQLTLASPKGQSVKCLP
jgi:hypothetical protein